ncbi:2-phosphosulfolactate phosphatase [Celeribacter ethanolicus]|uniref:Probable 2-phosphosulfolactate phosphatase n=1 Tax=Celeribacter ethanolicus TaxID=1758178 RepID=A0A291G7G5_9RHOB|nr:2-phosphosulfolactate phosphatase [Celeribacter ethanolicus]ATG46363.1 2-phosphosulfolactate phosphatase [Celeribacter ethanolicus]
MIRTLCEWGLPGAQSLAPGADVLVVIDVLSFSTCVDVATSRGARVYPYPSRDRSAAVAEAGRLGAELAGKRRDPGYSLSPDTLTSLPSGAALVLPSPNGARISFAARDLGRPVLVGCLRNASAVADRAAYLAGPTGTIALIPAGETWPDGSLRPAIEDQIGAGAIADRLTNAHSANLSPESQIARAAFAASSLPETLRCSVSGRELTGYGFPQDIDMAAALNVSTTAPLLQDGAFIA